MTSATIASIGHNNPPTKAEEHEARIVALYDEAKNWADGQPIASEEQAAKVAELDGMLLQAWKAADADRKAEKKPHDDAAKAVQEAFKPALTRAEVARNALGNLLTAWLRQVEAAKRAAEETARQEAEAKRAAAEVAFRESNVTDLEAREQAERLLVEAKDAEKIAAKAGKDKAKGLRTYYEVELTDTSAFARWLWQHRPEAMRAFLDGAAREFASEAGHTAPPPGLKVSQLKKA